MVTGPSRFLPLRRSCLGVLALSALAPSLARSADRGRPYVERLERRVREWERILPRVRRSAAAAADRILDGGVLYAAPGSQKAFHLEPLNRAGGMMLVKLLKPDTVLGKNDVVIAAACDGTRTETFAALARRAGEAGARVILFSAAADVAPSEAACVERVPAGGFAPDGSPVSIESVSNVVGLWAWTAEFAAACVRRGKTPCFYESYGLPGAIERAAALKDVNFHSRSEVTAAGADGLGVRWLATVRRALAALRTTEIPAIRKAAALVEAASSEGRRARVYAVGHLFPGELSSNPAPAVLTVGRAGDTLPSGEPFDAGDVAVLVGYQKFPWALTAGVAGRGGRCVLTCSRRPPAEFTGNAANVYINPYWPITDGAVALPGYDADILPLSGVMQATIYWQLVELL